ncbi:hypothetical protein, partial [Microvirga arsenatis]|uniref:hypothetical protein n=1 Tax=Microvirga arsenatis TaxID=2692265 RepID=UPI001AED890E
AGEICLQSAVVARRAFRAARRMSPARSSCYFLISTSDLRQNLEVPVALRKQRAVVEREAPDDPRPDE